jgi:predicted amidohydrolase YtcJ
MFRVRVASMALAAAVLVLPGVNTGDAAAKPGHADTVFRYGYIYTVDSYRSRAEAVAIRDGKFIAVGTNDEIKAFVGPETAVVNLGGRMVLPGIVDTHIHPVRGGLTANGVSFDSSATLAQVKAAVKKHIAKTKPKPGEWIEGAKWGTALQSTLTAKELDEVSPDNPVYLHDWTNHILAVNSKALAAAKITKDTKDPKEGKIDRDGSGNPTGILENKAASLVTTVVPPPTDAQLRKAAETVFANLSQFGVTSISTAQLDAGRLKTYRAMEKEGVLTLRIKGHWDYNTRYADAPLPVMASRFDSREKRGPRTPLIDPDGVKIYLDGVPNGYSSPYIEPYSDKATFGTQSIDAPSLNDAVLHFDTEGLQVMMHAVGDMAVRHGIDAVEAVRKVNGAGPRHHLAHATSVHPDDLGRVARLDLAVEISPWNTWAPDAGSSTWGKLLGRDRLSRLSPFRSLLEAGAVVGYGSDWDNVPEPDPWFAMQAAITRRNPVEPERGTMGENEAVDLATAIEIFTINGAHNLGFDGTTGSIEVGKDADMIVLDRNLFDIPTAKIHQTKVLRTVLGGRTVFER